MSFRERKDDYFVWVIAPYLETQDPNLQYYYDYTQSILEYTRVFSELGCEWKWVSVSLPAIEEEIRKIKEYITTKNKVVINLCDGDEQNGVPGLSVIAALEKYDLAY